MATLLSSDTDARWLPLSCQATPHTCTPASPLRPHAHTETQALRLSYIVRLCTKI